MTVTRLPSGNWRAVAYLGKDPHGRIVRKSFTHHDKKTAIAQAAACEAQNRSVEARNSFSREMRVFLKEKEPFLSPSTLAEYRSRSRCLLRDHSAFCSVGVFSLDEKHLRALVANLAASGLSPKTARNYMLFVSAVLRYAGVSMPKVDLPKKQLPDIYVPSDSEVKTLIDTVFDTPLYVPVLLAAFGPLRRGEICALKYPRDFDGDVIHVREAVAYDGRHHHVKAPKTPLSNRYIRLPQFVIDAIREQGFVTRLLPDQITHRFDTALRHAGLPKFRFHDLRHYCVSTLHAQGVPDAYIMQRGGWSTDGVLKKVYRHTLADQIKANEEKAISHFNRVMDI